MPGMEAARNRLETAIDRLESALARQPAAAGADAELDTLRRDFAALTLNTAAVSGRLDEMIARVRRILGEQGGEQG